jgi:hypothetical protein
VRNRTSYSRFSFRALPGCAYQLTVGPNDRLPVG